MNEEQPLREKPLTHQCVCLLVHRLVDSEREMRDKCFAEVPDPDSPFCLHCEEAGHPRLHEQAWERVVQRP